MQLTLWSRMTLRIAIMLTPAMRTQRTEMSMGRMDREQDVDDTDGKTENKIIDDWRLILVNSDNPIPDDYSFDLSSLDEFRNLIQGHR